MKEESLSLKNVCKKVGNEISIEKKKLEKEKKISLFWPYGKVKIWLRLVKGLYLRRLVVFTKKTLPHF